MHHEDICPIFEKALAILNQRWNTLIIYQLLNGRQRFSTIKDKLKISSRVLSERLKELENEYIVYRDVIPSTPVVIEYRLTEKGAALAPVLQEVEKWSKSWGNWQPKE